MILDDPEATRRAFLRNLWRWSAGLPERPIPEAFVDSNELAKTEWSTSFEGHMRRRLMFGAIRYGRMREQFKPQYDRVKAILARAVEYDDTGNLEMLVDVANLALLEFVEGRHPLAYFHATDDGQHVGTKGDGER